jgi:hypothetical protein
MMRYVMGCIICGEETEDLLTGLCSDCSAAIERHRDLVYEALMMAHSFRHKNAGFGALKAAIDELEITEREE